MYNVVPYKPKVMHIDNDLLNLPPIRNKRNFYPRKEKNCGDDFSTIIIDDDNLCDTIISRNTDLRRNNIPESIYLVLSSLHIGGAKYRVYLRKNTNWHKYYHLQNDWNDLVYNFGGYWQRRSN